MADGKWYIVRREKSDNGPLGSEYGYQKTQSPKPGELVYHGNFKPYTAYSGSNDKDASTWYEPIGEITSEPFLGEGVEKF
jgi:hypothetical protein